MQKPTVYDHRNVYDNGGGGGGSNINGSVLIDDTLYPYKKYGNLLWTTSNLCWRPSNFLSTGSANDKPRALTWGVNEGVTFLYGLYYNLKAIQELNNLLSDGWRVANKSDWLNLFNELGGQSNCGKKMQTKYNGWGTNESNFNIFLVGYMNAGSLVGGGSFIKIATPQNDGTYCDSFIWRGNQNYVETQYTEISTSQTTLRICKDA